MQEKFDKLKMSLTRSGEYLTRLNGLNQYYDHENQDVANFRNYLSYIISGTQECLTQEGNIEQLKQNNEHLGKLQAMKTFGRNFEVSAMYGKVMNNCVSCCAKADEILKQTELGQISATGAMTEICQIISEHLSVVDEYNTTLYGLEMSPISAFQEMLDTTFQSLKEGYRKIEAMPDLDMQQVSRDYVPSKGVPKDPIIQSRIDENNALIGRIEAGAAQRDSIRIERNIEAALDDALQSMDQMFAQMDEMFMGDRINVDIGTLYKDMNNVAGSLQALYQQQIELQNTREDYSYVSAQYGAEIDAAIQGCQSDINNYYFELSEKAVDTLKSIPTESFAASESVRKVAQLSTRIMSSMLQVPGHETLKGSLLSEINEIQQQIDGAVREQPSTETQQEKPIEEVMTSEEVSEEDIKRAMDDALQKEEGETLQEEITQQETTQQPTELANEAQAGKQAPVFESNNILTESDAEILNQTIKDLGKYDRVKDTLLNDPNIQISPRFRSALENNTLEGHISEVCANVPQTETAADLPFMPEEEAEIKDIISNLYKEGYSEEEVLGAAVQQIKSGSSAGLQETWNALRTQFNEKNHLYYYLTKEYVQDVAKNVALELGIDKDGAGMDME